MATMYSVQAFTLKGNRLVPDALTRCKTEASAIETAERLAGSKAGVVAFSQKVGVNLDTYEDPQVLLKIGRLPPALE